MGWFEEQIKMRRDSDNEALDDSLKNVSAIIKGKKGFSFGDDSDREKIKGVLDGILGELLSDRNKEMWDALLLQR